MCVDIVDRKKRIIYHIKDDDQSCEGIAKDRKREFIEKKREFLLEFNVNLFIQFIVNTYLPIPSVFNFKEFYVCTKRRFRKI